MNHVEEMLNLMAAVSGDRRFEIVQNEAEERKVLKMEDWLAKREEKAAAKATAEAAAKEAKTLLNNIDSLMKNEGFSIERACRALNSSVTKYEAAKKFLADASAVV